MDEAHLERGVADAAELRIPAEQTVGDGVAIAGAQGHGRHPGGFVDGDDRIVGVEDRQGQLGLGRQVAIERGEVDAHNVAGAQRLALSAAPAIHHDGAGADRQAGAAA